MKNVIIMLSLTFVALLGFIGCLAWALWSLDFWPFVLTIVFFVIMILFALETQDTARAHMDNPYDK